MATTKASGPISADRLKSFIERIEKLEEERKAIGGDVKDVYSEAKGVGYDVATMRKIVAIRAKDTADVAEQETLLDVYKHALGMLTGGTVTTVRVPKEPSEEELEERAGRIVGEVDRCMDLVTDGQPPGIYAIQGLIGCSAGKASKLRGLVQDRISREIAKVREMKKPEDSDDGIKNAAPLESNLSASPQKAEPDGGVGTAASLGGPAALPPHVTSRFPPSHHTPNEAPATPSVGAVAAQPRVACSEMPDIPAFLRRSAA